MGHMLTFDFCPFVREEPFSAGYGTCHLSGQSGKKYQISTFINVNKIVSQMQFELGVR